eukprot:TRINITY_DN12803_c0_g1_i1.p1 TRINITY_DN12803_c0_g1~~TRINITY_DN12803_c0_g1_i1.p1  ORF type:complete len:223 (-),score=41.22 TRINITY_DN12803_c0_g1_i1:131-799(-)
MMRFTLLAVAVLLAIFVCPTSADLRTSCALNYTMPQKLDLTAYQGTWYIYSHQPDFFEWLFTRNCYCTGTNVTANTTSTTSKGTVTNYCRLNSASGDVSNFGGDLKEFDAVSTVHGILLLVRHVYFFDESNYYQVLDNIDNKHALLYVCSEYLPGVVSKRLLLRLLGEQGSTKERRGNASRGCDQIYLQVEGAGIVQPIKVERRLQGQTSELLVEISTLEQK